MEKNYATWHRVILCFMLLLTTKVAFAQTPSFWQTANERTTTAGKRPIIPQKYQVFSLDVPSFLAYIPQITKGDVAQLRNATSIIALPMPDGSTQNFSVFETPMLSPAFAAKLPYVKTFTAQGIEDASATAYLDWTLQGFHGMILSANGTVFIDPFSTESNDLYISYYKKDYFDVEKAKLRTCTTIADESWYKYEKERDKRFANRAFGLKEAARPSGSQKRTYRIAVAATAEYGNKFASQAAAVNATITTINRVRGVYEKEVAISFTMVDNTAIVFFGSTSADPFTGNSNGGILIDESQTVIDNNIGSSNYDIGHTFSTGGGGLAGLGVVCNSSNKGRGITGSPSPTGDSYDIDYVAHEIGHQFGAPHTFNGNIGSCSGGNRAGSSAYEPGSGTTIMAYAGICGSDDVQNNSDAYFHTKSYDNILDYTTSGTGNSCPVQVATGNAIPILTMPTGGFSIPKDTPFALTASATDASPEGDVLTYCWEQFNLGSAGPPENSGASGPSFRSFSPTTNPTRYFPRTAGNPNLSTAIGETLPAQARTFTFRCTVRDGKAIGGVEYGTINFSVADSGPFAVTFPNTFVTWDNGTTKTITWSVNGTNTAPVSCANVNILLSTDGGLTYPTVLASNVPNDGSQDILVPDVSTTQARIKVQAVGNIFFDISDSNFKIQISAPTFNMQVTPAEQTVTAPNNAVYQIQLSALGGFGTNVTLSASGNPAGTTATFGVNTLAPTSNTNLTISGITSSVIGTHNITVTGVSGAITRTVIVKMIVQGSTFEMQVTPAQQTIAPSANAVYQIQLTALLGFATDVNFSVSGNPTGTTATFGANPLAPNGSTTLTITNTAGITGSHDITISATTGLITRTAIVKMIISTPSVPSGSGGAVTLYPNPATESIIIKIGASITKADVIITDMLGKEVKSFTIQKGTGDFMYELRIGDKRTSDHLPNGNYIMQIKSDTETWVRKFVKNEK